MSILDDKPFSDVGNAREATWSAANLQANSTRHHVIKESERGLIGCGPTPNGTIKPLRALVILSLCEKFVSRGANSSVSQISKYRLLPKSEKVSSLTPPTGFIKNPNEFATLEK